MRIAFGPSCRTAITGLLSVALLLAPGCSSSSTPADATVDVPPDAGLDLPGPPDAAVDTGSDGSSGDMDPKLLGHAHQAARWIEANARGDGGVAWWDEYVGVPAWDGAVAHPVSLYSGVAGIALFLKKIGDATGDAQHSQAAQAAVKHLAATAIKTADGYYWENEVELKSGQIITYDSKGLYDGAAGVGYTLLMLGQQPANATYQELARGAASWIMAQATRSGGCSWTYGQTDIIAGNAGIILFLIEMHRVTGDKKYLDDASCAADWLLAQGTKEGEGLYWPSMQGSTSIYTGMSHGVAGVSYALASLYEATKQVKYLDAAKAGAKWLQAEAVCDQLGCRWYHDKPDATDMFQTGWCHGVSGTARLLLLLERLTGDAAYLTLAQEGARWVMQVADPALAAPEFWGLSFCCGAASVGEFFLDLFGKTGKQQYLQFAHKVADYLIAQGKQDSGGMKWTNYDYPDSTGRIWYGTGLKLGAAGVGWFLLRLAQSGSSTKDWPVIPDERL